MGRPTPRHQSLSRDPAQWPHGSRARYVCGCRCAECRNANRLQSIARKKKVDEAALELEPSGPPIPSTMRRGGKDHKILRCPGVGGDPCVATPATWLGQGNAFCRMCVARFAFDGIVDSAPVIEHIQLLSMAGVGRRAIAEAGDVSRGAIGELLRGEQTIRASTAKKILALDVGAMSDSALVKRVDEARAIFRQLRKDGWRVEEIAKRMGISMGGVYRQIQPGKTHMLLKNLMKWKAIHRSLMG